VCLWRPLSVGVGSTAPHSVLLVIDLIDLCNVSYHQFTDDTQLVVAVNVSDATPVLKRFANCSAAVQSWFLWNDLQLNADNSEAVILGAAPQIRSAATIRAVMVASSRLHVIVFSLEYDSVHRSANAEGCNVSFVTDG